ncbi:MAG: membrane protein insertase YidC [Acidobacteria bacterium]|nr:membrane protein insertase YidC [Acidobacteriota bacterium]
MDHEKRVILAFALSFAILLLWRVFLVPEAPQQPAQPSPASPATTPVTPSETPKPPASPPAAAAQLPKPAAIPLQQGTQAEEIVIEGEVCRVMLSTQGAVIKSWILMNFHDEKGKPLDLVHSAASKELGFPLSLSVADPEVSKKLNAALFVAQPAGRTLSAPAKLELVYSDGEIQARKQLEFGPGYEVRVEVSVSDGERFLPVEVAWPGGFGDPSASNALADTMVRGFYQPKGDTKVHEEYLTTSFWSRVGSWFSGSPQVDSLNMEIPTPVELAGLADRYFVSVFLPASPDAKFTLFRRPWTPPDWKGKEEERPKPLMLSLSAPQPKPVAFRLFVAPRDLEVLRASDPPLDHLVDYGWFSFVAKPLFLALRYIYDNWIHNYGWAIILLTVIINMAFLPLKLKQIRSAQGMQRVAPLVKGIQEKYKQFKFNDPRKQKMQQEIMKIYKEHNINPLGGCLPMLLQLPFLYGFYMVLYISIEMRHAPWFAWVKDLSAPDPYYVLPIIMTVSMFFMQKMTPMTVADPAQQRMMMIMPIVFGFISVNFASGLVLYWMTSNLVGIGQQLFIIRMSPPPQPAGARKSASTGKAVAAKE